MPFFEPLPPIPEPTVEQPTGWRPPLWDRPSEATIGAPVPIVAVLGKTDRVALVFSNVAAFRNGFTFDLVVQRNPMAPRSADEGPPSWFMGGPPHLRRGPRVGFEFADGTRVAEQGPVPFAGRSLQLIAGSGNRDDGIPAGPILAPRGGGGGGHDRFEMGFWLFPLPPRGPMKVYSEWIAVDLAESMTVVDASIIVDAAEHSIALWEPPPET